MGKDDIGAVVGNDVDGPAVGDDVLGCSVKMCVGENVSSSGLLLHATGQTTVVSGVHAKN